VRGLTALGKTILLTTHFMDEAQVLADRLAIISEGAIVATGTPDELIGSGSATTRIRFQLPEAAEPPAELGARPTASGWEIETDAPTRAVHDLTGWALGAGTELGELEITRRSLEDVYPQLTEDATA
jgi:ABC-2 type transport system ATP-binding protein